MSTPMTIRSAAGAATPQVAHRSWSFDPEHITVSPAGGQVRLA
jgi:hypothetical protein